jgi:hypothetical protein
VQDDNILLNETVTLMVIIWPDNTAPTENQPTVGQTQIVVKIKLKKVL